MEFLLFLTAKEKEILELVYKANFSVEENTPLCLIGDKFFGFIKKRQKTMVICTENAKKMSGYKTNSYSRPESKERAGIIIRRAVRHESVHVAQACNNSKKLNLINPNEKIHTWYKQGVLKGSTSITTIDPEREYEAYIMEDRPKLVKSALIKYCL